MSDQIEYPKLRPVERVPVSGEERVVVLRDPSGIAENMLALGGPTLYVAAMMDGRHSRTDIQAEFMRRFGEILFSNQLDEIIQKLDDAHYLESPRLRTHRDKLRADYRAAPYRPLREGASFAPDNRDLDEYLDEMLATSDPGQDRVAGFVAPHLDYPRGVACYAAAYSGLAERTRARRLVILGTNHFGEATAVTGTKKDFDTPHGVVAHDGKFMDELDSRCGADLCERELDHAREHSVELQVVLLKKVLGRRPFTIVPYLCPDACGSTGTVPMDGRGADLRSFAAHLRDLIAEDGVPTCIIAGADLSHIGRFFGDERPLDDAYLESVRASDSEAVSHLLAADPDGFLACVKTTRNSTKICSTGCLYVIASVLQGRARPVLRHYHQAVTAELENCVTCAAVDYVV